MAAIRRDLQSRASANLRLAMARFGLAAADFACYSKRARLKSLAKLPL
jgi:hypothetical protein